MSFQNVDRRDFIKTALAGLVLGADLIAAQEPGPSGIPVRPLGNTGEKVSIIGIGGWDIAAVPDKDEAISIMHEAIDLGVTFFDNCWEYLQGGAETLMGKALSTENRRDKVFLMTKVCARDYTGAKQQLEDSLRRLQTDHLDLWQFHGIKWDDDPDLIFDPEHGAIGAALEAREAGKIRYVGFSGHQHPKHHLRMLEKPFQWDTVQMPVNVLDAHYHSFQKQVLPIAVEKRTSVLGMKGLAAQNGIIVRQLGLSAEQARRYSLSLPISTLICGIQSQYNLHQDVNIARNFTPMTEEEVQEIYSVAKKYALDGSLEQYKIGNYGCDWHHENRM